MGKLEFLQGLLTLLSGGGLVQWFNWRSNRKKAKMGVTSEQYTTFQNTVDNYNTRSAEYMEEITKLRELQVERNEELKELRVELRESKARIEDLLKKNNNLVEENNRLLKQVAEVEMLLSKQNEVG